MTFFRRRRRRTLQQLHGKINYINCRETRLILSVKNSENHWLPTVQSQNPVNQWLGGELIAHLLHRPDPSEPVAGWGTYCTLTAQSQTPVNQWLGGELIALLLHSPRPQ